jgi:hypothetical protein
MVYHGVNGCPIPKLSLCSLVDLVKSRSSLHECSHVDLVRLAAVLVDDIDRVES